MKKSKVIVLAALMLGTVFSVLTYAVVVGTETQTGLQVAIFEAGDIIPNPDPCICSAVFDPVACGTFPNRKAYSNACVATCDGQSSCQQIEVQF